MDEWRETDWGVAFTSAALTAGMEKNHAFRLALHIDGKEKYFFMIISLLRGPIRTSFFWLSLVSSGGCAVAAANSTALNPEKGGLVSPEKPGFSAPRLVLERFDSLLNAEAFDSAEVLCVGDARRMFGFIVQAQKKLRPFIDTVQSTDTVLEERQAGKWAAVKVSSQVVFLRPLMGMREIRSLQAVHLFLDSSGWKLASFEELTDSAGSLTLKTGEPSNSKAGPEIQGPWFPVSAHAPNQSFDRMVFKVKWRDGKGAGPLVDAGFQKVLSGDLQQGWKVQTRLTEIPPLPKGSKKSKPENPEMAPYLNASEWILLSDSLLRQKADSLTAGRSPQESAARIHSYLGENFQFALGAVLFGNSRDALRDMKGDCSEAAVLSAALLRAARIPARILLGFATVGRGVFIGHAWNEIYLEGKWIGFDAALREYPARPGRLALLVSDGSGDLRIAATNLMLKTMNNLDLEIVEATQGGKKVPLVEMSGNISESMDFFHQMLEGVGK
jgi:hypothetical protein